MERGAGGVLGFCRAADQSVGVRPSPLAPGPIAPTTVDNKFQAFQTPDEEDDMPEVPVLGEAGDLGALEPASEAKQQETTEDEQKEERMRKVIEHHQAIKSEIHEAASELAERQREAWLEKSMARREGRKPRREFAERHMAAESKLTALRYEGELYHDGVLREGVASTFQGRP